MTDRSITNRVDPTRMQARVRKGLTSHRPIPGWVRSKTDFYVTPPRLACQLVSIARDLNLFIGDVLDIGAGTGVWGYAYRTVVGTEPPIDGVDLYNHTKPEWYRHWYTTDFLEWKPSQSYHSAIGNPPFYAANYLLTFCRSIGVQNAAFLLRLSFMASRTRLSSYWTNGLAPKYVYIFDKRPMFMPTKGTFSFDVAFFIWDFTNPTYETTARFIEADIGTHADLIPFYNESLYTGYGDLDRADNSSASEEGVYE